MGNYQYENDYFNQNLIKLILYPQLELFASVKKYFMGRISVLSCYHFLHQSQRD